MTVCIFIDGPGGYGKTFLLNAIIGQLCQQRKIVLAVPLSGILSLLLYRGHTAYSQFKIPIDLDEYATCNVSKQSGLANLLRETLLIIWDETPMSNRYVIEAVDRTLQDVCDNTSPFGGKCIVFSGDFRQTLPIIADASVPEVVGACFNHSALWQNIRHMRLRQNMRLDPTSQH